MTNGELNRRRVRQRKEIKAVMSDIYLFMLFVSHFGIWLVVAFVSWIVISTSEENNRLRSRIYDIERRTSIVERMQEPTQ
jgi:hypothetical protein